MLNMLKLAAKLIAKVLAILWRIYCFPGYIILWIMYYFPTEWGKKRNTARGARQWQKRTFFAPFWTTVVIIYLLLSISS